MLNHNDTESYFISKGFIVFDKGYITQYDGLQWILISNPKYDEKTDSIKGVMSYYRKLEAVLENILEDKLSRKLKGTFKEVEFLKALKGVRKDVMRKATEADLYCRGASEELHKYMNRGECGG